MANGFIGKIAANSSKEGTFDGSIVEADGDVLATFTAIVVTDSKGNPLKNASECAINSFVHFKTEGGVEGAPVVSVMRKASVVIDGDSSDDNANKQIRQVSRIVGNDKDPMINKVTIVKG